MKKQTAMQELIDEIVEHLTYDDDLTEDSRITLETIRLRCLGKLATEKQQIIDSYYQGAYGGDSVLGEQYFELTFNKD
jgi:hypothetical protein